MKLDINEVQPWRDVFLVTGVDGQRNEDIGYLVGLLDERLAHLGVRTVLFGGGEFSFSILRAAPRPMSSAPASTGDGAINAEQPRPTPNGHVSIQSLVRADLEDRERLGIERYGTPLQPHNGRDAQRDAYEEALDLVCYLKQARVEASDALAGG